MDVATHLLVPYAAALLALGFWRRGSELDRPRGAIALIFGVAATAPDADGALSFLGHASTRFFWLQHRGISHSLVGAPVFALLVVGLFALGARAWPRRLGLFVWRGAFVPAAILGSWTHLVLDGVTYGGVPLVFPFAYGRVGVPVYHWLVTWLFPLGAVALFAHSFGKLDRRGVIVAGALVVAILVVLGGLRLATRPMGTDVYPRVAETDWVVLERATNGSWSAHTTRLPDALDWFPDDAPPEARSAIDQAKGTDAYRGFLLGAFGPMATRAERAPDGSWIVTFTNVAQRFEAQHEPSWTPTRPFEEWGMERLAVRGETVTVLNDGW